MDEPLANERLHFYLQHQRRIEEWAALGREVREAIGKTICSLAPVVAARVRDLDPDAVVTAGMAGDDKRPLPAIARRSWPSEFGNPHVAFVIAWDAQVSPSGAVPPWSGLLVGRIGGAKHPAEDVLRKYAKQTTKQPYVEGSYPVLYRWLRADPSWWLDLPAWKESMIGGLIQTWTDWASAVDGVLTSAELSSMRAPGIPLG
jgi:hypothetical protein